MSYLIGIVAFTFTLGAMLVAFDEFMPQSYFEWIQKHRWGRELVGMLMLGVALLVGLAAYWLVR